MLVASSELDHSESTMCRAQVYRLLATAYARPVDEQLLALFHQWSRTEKLSPEFLPELLVRGLNKVETWFEKNTSSSSKELCSVLSAEFTKLFRGLTRLTSPPPPYESVYVNSGLLYGAATDGVTEKYRQFRLKSADNEPPDHISLELDFMAYLCEKEAEELEKKQESLNWIQEENTFLNEHLCGWVPALCQKIRESDTTGFYDGLADITEGWIYCDHAVVNDLLNYYPSESVV